MFFIQQLISNFMFVPICHKINVVDPLCHRASPVDKHNKSKAHWGTLLLNLLTSEDELTRFLRMFCCRRWMSILLVIHIKKLILNIGRVQQVNKLILEGL